MNPLKKCMAKSMLEHFLGYPPSDDQVLNFLSYIKKGNSAHLCLGDIAIPLKAQVIKSLGSLVSSLGTFINDRSDENCKKAIESLRNAKFPVEKIWIQNDVLYINYNRSKLRSLILKEVESNLFSYGKDTQLESTKITVIPDTSDGSSRSYRVNKVAFHIGELLKFAGATVDVSKCSATDVPVQDVPTAQDSSSFTSSSEQLAEGESEFERLAALSLTETKEVKTKKKGSLFKDVLNILDPFVPLPKDTKKVFVDTVADVYKDIKSMVQAPKEPEAKAESYSYTVKDESDEVYPCVSSDKMFTPACFSAYPAERMPVWVDSTKNEIQSEDADQKKEASQEKVINLYVVSRVVPDTTIPKSNQFLCGSLIDMKYNRAWNGSSEDLCKILVEELRLAGEKKHGPINSLEYYQFLEEQARRCMTLQMMAVAHSSTVKVDTEGITQNTRESVFILYNYARLCNIFETFEDGVSKGEIPPLPDVDNVDLDLLSSDEEWLLIWRYIFHWPDIIEENTKAVLEGSGRLRTAAVTKFLGSLAHRVSQYYCRYHVLCEPLPHLLPTIYARLHLLKAIKIIMEICFKTLGIESPATFM